MFFLFPCFLVFPPFFSPFFSPFLFPLSFGKTIVDWVDGHAKMKKKVSTVAATQNLLREW